MFPASCAVPTATRRAVAAGDAVAAFALSEPGAGSDAAALALAAEPDHGREAETALARAGDRISCVRP